jgi:diguanylate cyclase (GGDEF)-like protein
MEFEDKTSVIDSSRLATLKRDAAQRSACFIVIAGSQAGRMYKLERDELVIGRSPDVGIHINDDGVSRRHAQITRRSDGSVFITDLKSTNGTFCNGERVDVRVLQDGDKIQIGTTTILKFSFQDTVEEDFQRRQYESATRDSLTRCFNKKHFLERLPSELSFAARHSKGLSLAMMDIDHFKATNDTFGHLAGDYVLREVARLMQESVRVDDLLARYGGEEFALIMRETTSDKAFVAVERIRRKIEAASFSFERKIISVTISAGIASWGDGYPESAEALIKLADECLYRAKSNGRNRTESHAVDGRETAFE